MRFKFKRFVLFVLLVVSGLNNQAISQNILDADHTNSDDLASDEHASHHVHFDDFASHANASDHLDDQSISSSSLINQAGSIDFSHGLIHEATEVGFGDLGVDETGNNVNSLRRQVSFYQGGQDGCGGSGTDGEGCAEIVGVDHLIAGQPETFKVRFQAGDTGIAVGGGVSIGFHHGSSWAVQVVSPVNHAGYVKISSPNASNISLEWRNYPPAGMLSNSPPINSDWIFHNVLIAKIVNQALLPGEVVEFTFGANDKKIIIQRYVDVDHEFRVTTDVDANGSYKGISSSPTIEIMHASGSELAATAPAQAKLNEPFDILVRLEDENYNVVENYQGTVQITDEIGQVVPNNLTIINGIASGQVSIGSVGPHRLRIASNDGLYAGRSNPIKVYDELPERRLFWGDLHGHTNISDGLGRDADEYFEFGRDVAALDFIALTDHGHFDWPANIQAVKDHYEPGKYVTLLAQEGGPGPNHMNIYYRRDDTAHISTWPSNYQSFMDHTLNQFNFDPANPEAMTGPHHFAYDTGAAGDPQYPFGIWDTKIARFVEVYSSHGTSEFPGNPRPLGRPSTDPALYMQDALAQGLKFGVIAASDNHDSRPGRSIWGAYPNGLAGVWADDLTRDSIWDSLWNYSTYGTSIDRIYTEFYINSHPMGSELDANGALVISGYIIGKTDQLSVSIIKNNQEIRTFDSSNGVIDFSFDDEPELGDHFYYLRVTQSNGERAWTSPIWVKSVDTPVVEEPVYSDQIPAVVSFSVPSQPFQSLASSSTLIEGSVYDLGGSGVKNVFIALYNQDTQNWVNANGVALTWLEMQASLIAINSQSSNWQLSVELPSGQYWAFARAIDNAGNVDRDAAGNLDWDSMPFIVEESILPDNIAPQVSLSTPAFEHENVPQSFSLEGSFLDTGGSGMNAVRVMIYSTQTNHWVNSTGGSVDSIDYQAQLIRTNAHSGSWYLPLNLPAGTYRAFVRGIDNAGNFSSDALGNVDWVTTPFIVSSLGELDSTDPSVSITRPNIAFDALYQFTPLEGEFIDNGGAAIKEVRVAIYNSDAKQWIDTSGNAVVWQEFNASLVLTNPQSGSWYLPIQLLPGNYRVFAIAKDSSGNYLRDTVGNPDWTSTPFRVVNDTPADTEPPQAAISVPTYASEQLSTAVTLQGNVSDTGGSGIKDVFIAIYNSDAAVWSDLSAQTVSWQEFRAELNQTSPHSASWSLPTSLPAGNYRVFARVIDYANNVAVNADNETAWVSRPFSLQ